MTSSSVAAAKLLDRVRATTGRTDIAECTLGRATTPVAMAAWPGMASVLARGGAGHMARTPPADVAIDKWVKEAAAATGHVPLVHLVPHGIAAGNSHAIVAPPPRAASVDRRPRVHVFVYTRPGGTAHPVYARLDSGEVLCAIRPVS